jgi:hypothetical protein
VSQGTQIGFSTRKIGFSHTRPVAKTVAQFLSKKVSRSREKHRGNKIKLVKTNIFWLVLSPEKNKKS